MIDYFVVSRLIDNNMLIGGGKSSGYYYYRIFHIVLAVVAIFLSIRRHKEDSMGKRIGMVIFAILLPYIYIIYHLFTSKNLSKLE